MATTSAGERSTNRSEHSVSKSMGLDDGTTSIGRPRGPRTPVLHRREFVPSSRLIPSSPATFPCTSMIRCAFLSSFPSRAFRRSSLRTFSSSGFRSGLRPRFFDRAFSDPLCAALRHVVRCEALSPQDDPPRRARCTGPLLRRSAACTTDCLSTTSGSCRASSTENSHRCSDAPCPEVD